MTVKRIKSTGVDSLDITSVQVTVTGGDWYHDTPIKTNNTTLDTWVTNAQWSDDGGAEIAYKQWGVANFSGAATASVVEYTAADGFAFDVHGVLVASSYTNDKIAVYHRYAAFKFLSGTLAQVGSTDNGGTTDKEEAGFYGAGSPTIALNCATNVIRLRYTTPNADDVRVSGWLYLHRRPIA